MFFWLSLGIGRPSLNLLCFPQTVDADFARSVGASFISQTSLNGVVPSGLVTPGSVMDVLRSERRVRTSDEAEHRKPVAEIKDPAALVCFASSKADYEEAYGAKALHFQLLTAGFDYTQMVL